MKRRTLALISVSLLLGCAAPPHNKNKEEAQARWEQMRAKVKFQLAERSFDSGQVDDAMKLCQEVIALYPAHLDAWLLMTRLQLEKGQLAEAEAALAAASGLGQAAPELDYLVGVAAEHRERMDDALAAYKRAYEVKSNEADYLLAYAECLLALDRVAEAADLLEARQRDFEQEVRVQLLLAQALSLADRPREAADEYLSILRLAPEEPMIREEAGFALLNAGRLSETAIVLEPMLRSLQDGPSATLLQAWATRLLEARDARQAAKVLEAATSRYPQVSPPWMLLSKAYLMLEQPALARDAARRACDLQQESVDARLLLAYSCLAAGDRDGASVAAQRIIAARPNDSEALLILQRALEPPTVR